MDHDADKCRDPECQCCWEAWLDANPEVRRTLLDEDDGLIFMLD